MPLSRRVLAADPRSFGRGPLRELGGLGPRAGGIHPDVKLFLTTFIAGFLFVSVLIG